MNGELIMNKNTTRDTVKALIVTALFLAVIGGAAFFSYNVDALTALKEWTENTFNGLQGPFIVLTLVLLSGSIGMNVLGYYLMALSDQDYRLMNAQNNDESRDTSNDGIIRRLLAGPCFSREVYNGLSVTGIIVLQIAEVFTQCVISIFVVNFVMLFTNNLWIVLGVFLFVILITYRPVMYFVEWIFTNGKLPFFKRTKNFDFKREGDEEKIKSWNIVVGAIFTVYTVVITMLGIIDQSILTVLNEDNNLLSTLMIGSVGVITSALRAAKGSLRVL